MFFHWMMEDIVRIFCSIITTDPEFAAVKNLEGVATTKNPCTPIFAVPITAGTVAEVTMNYVITSPERTCTMVCVDIHDIPMVAFVDPEMKSSCQWMQMMLPTTRACILLFGCQEGLQTDDIGVLLICQELFEGLNGHTGPLCGLLYRNQVV